MRNTINASLAGKIDHTLLKPQAVEFDIRRLCAEAKEFGFKTVCVHPSFVRLARESLAGTSVGVCTVVGFPLGAATSHMNAAEAREAVLNGADEIDMVVNIGWVKSAKNRQAEAEIRGVKEASRGKTLKVILETALLTDEEKVRGTLLARRGGADFIKTSTGFGGGGATVRDVRILCEAAGPSMRVKASGGIGTYEFARQLIEAGASRIGTSSSVAILKESLGGKNG